MEELVHSFVYILIHSNLWFRIFFPSLSLAEIQAHVLVHRLHYQSPNVHRDQQFADNQQPKKY